MTFQTLELHYLYKADWNRSKKLLCHMCIFGGHQIYISFLAIRAKLPVLPWRKKLSC